MLCVCFVVDERKWMKFNYFPTYVAFTCSLLHVHCACPVKFFVKIAVVFNCWPYNLKGKAASDMTVNDECKLMFLELKAKRTYRSIVFKIEEKQKQVVVEQVGELTQSYEDFIASLPADECRYACL